MATTSNGAQFLILFDIFSYEYIPLTQLSNLFWHVNANNLNKITKVFESPGHVYWLRNNKAIRMLMLLHFSEYLCLIYGIIHGECLIKQEGKNKIK